MRNDFKPPKRRDAVIRPHGTSAVVTIDRIDSVDSMMDNALNILAEQIHRLKLTSSNHTLDEKEVKNLKSFITSLVEISKEEREREKRSDLSDLTDEQLLERFQERLIKAPK